MGTDITSKHRFINLIENERFLKRLLTAKERFRYDEECNTSLQKITFLAKRWAGKEAFSKALGTGIGQKCSFQDIECSHNELGKPMIFFSRTDFEASFKESFKVHISYSDEKDTVIAFVIIEM